MPVYADDQLCQIKLHGGMNLYVSYTHVEQDGKHTVVITTDKENMEKLEKSAEKITEDIRKEHGVDAKDLAYYELHSDGKLFRVDVGELGPVSPRGTPENLRERGGWSNTTDVRERLVGAGLPTTEVERARQARGDMAQAARSEQNLPSDKAGSKPWDAHQPNQEREPQR